MRDMVRSSSKLEQSGLVGVATCYDVAGKWRATRAASFATLPPGHGPALQLQPPPQQQQPHQYAYVPPEFMELGLTGGSANDGSRTGNGWASFVHGTGLLDGGGI
ncbi:uncharacterized protein STEHIDRAFT_163810 [Stereum hirsutum FP-91666 SS1]|uniref:Uncharacterized protein n=1 Tax=Stereum hirsutum (strain FP-91666) TaxID=721885 RepID=R7RY56_STEHR|nr:uncharacterized protein STEHIDRAFT_163810 [Stereum hirsutum FP-91666 SS1]EIM79287.1 hypothetical protein STEHIDRAFT_163810 [Stereum hirsutum FP-91666 SS1]